MVSAMIKLIDRKNISNSLKMYNYDSEYYSIRTIWKDGKLDDLSFERKNPLFPNIKVTGDFKCYASDDEEIEKLTPEEKQIYIGNKVRAFSFVNGELNSFVYGLKGMRV